MSKTGDRIAQVATPLLLVTAVLSFCVSRPDIGSGASASACPPLQPGALWLPDDRSAWRNLLEREAQRLNDSGQCVLEGSWGAQTKTFYIAVRPPGQAPRHVRFTEQELASR